MKLSVIQLTKPIIIVIVCMMMVTYACAQFSQRARDSINKLSYEDHQAMMQQLGITTLRQGADGNNPKALNAANYDEAKANPYPILPDPLVFKNGKPVTSAKDWRKRRKEIEEDFSREIYGRLPAKLPSIHWEVLRSTDTVINGYAATQKQMAGHVDNTQYPSIDVTIRLNYTTPANASKVPMIIEFGFLFPPRPGDTTKPTAPAWQVDCLSRGWGFAVLFPNSVQADNGAGLTQGIIGLVNKGQRRKPDDWGALRAWAWGASSALDYFATITAVDAKKIAIAGHSRYGKAALVTLAYDERFATAYVSSSGEGGAKLHRRNMGEIVENLAGSGEYHWMAGNFIKYGGSLNWNDLPVDAHELIAMCAPRPVFIGTGDKGDGWVDAKGMFMAASAAGPVYRLLGKKDMGTDVYPPIETSLTTGALAFRQHSGGHTPAPNWPVFLEWAARWFK